MISTLSLNEFLIIIEGERQSRRSLIWAVPKYFTLKPDIEVILIIHCIDYVAC